MSYNAIVNPKMLKWARESFGLSLEELSNRTEIPVDLLEKAENGTARLTLDEARLVARECGTNLAALYLDEVPAGKRCLVGLETLSRNFHRLQLGPDYDIWFSYSTPVAVRTPNGIFVARNDWGKTTARHLNIIGKKRRYPKEVIWEIIEKEVLGWE